MGGGADSSGTGNLPPYTGRVSPSVQLVYLHLNFKMILNWTNNNKFMSFLSSELFTPMNTGHKLFIEVNYCKYFIFFSPSDKISEYKM